MATYPGMNLSGEIRESISLDEDDLSDVEDEVFIRDGKARFKYSEDIGLKRPLMAPRRKLTKPDFKSRLRNRPPCRPYCKPCCYFCGGVLVIFGLITLVVVVVSMFPLPIDKMRKWIVPKSVEENRTELLLPCSELNITNVWKVTLPKLTSETSIRTVDINKDGVEDVIFGFGTGDSSSLPDEIFCPMFMGVAGPCGGGVIALNGVDGSIMWRKHLPYVVLTTFCSSDLNGDGIDDCLVTGNKGMLLAISANNGTTIWDFNDATKASDLKIDSYAGNFIPDQDRDDVDDILVAHTSQGETETLGHLILISGKSGNEIKRVATPNNVETYYIPQLLPQMDGQYVILLGTGSPSSRGNLTTITMANLLNGTAIFNTVFEHASSGIISPSILVDITGDRNLDIITALFNRTVIALDGVTFKQIWNVTVNNSETLSLPTPGYFTDDNVTDFLVKYQTGTGFPVYYYSQTFVINGATGEVIKSSYIEDTVGSQMGALTLSTEKHGYDFFLYWTADCRNYEGRKDKFAFLNDATLGELNNADLCRLRFNSSKVIKLNALNQYDQPPGMEIYSSDAMTDVEYNNTRTPLEEAAEYLRLHPEVQVLKNPVYEEKQRPNIQQNGKSSSFRHKFDNQGLLKNYGKQNRQQQQQQGQQITEKYEDYDQFASGLKLRYPNGLPAQLPEDEEEAYNYDDDLPQTYNKFDMNNRDTRGDLSNPSLKKDLGKTGIYGFKNVEQSRHRLMNDLNSSPTEILKDTYFKNLERQLRKSRFEQRDLKSHHDKMKDNEEIRRVISEEKQRALNVSVNLWDLETEKEIEDRKLGYARGKRNSGGNVTVNGIPFTNSIGTLVKTLHPTANAVDLIFLTYWTPSKPGPILVLQKDIECIDNKMKNIKDSKEELSSNVDKEDVRAQYQKDCLNERGAYQALEDDEEQERQNQSVGMNENIAYNKEISELRLGQLTIYRVRIECARCNIRNKGERCAKFLNPTSTNSWSAYLNRRGDGVFGSL